LNLQHTTKRQGGIPIWAKEQRSTKQQQSTKEQQKNKV
jgi:hypothetical protein